MIWKRKVRHYKNVEENFVDFYAYFPLTRDKIYTIIYNVALCLNDVKKKEINKMHKHYTMTIAGKERHLPLFPINENLQIAAFIMFGDVEITVESAKALAEKAPDFDVAITAESKGIPLTYEFAKITGKDYIAARKAPKLYMDNIISTEVDSITTAGVQKLCLGSSDAEKMKGKRVLIIDDVISTGESLLALEKLVGLCGGNVVGKMAVLAEGEAADRDDIIFLEKLPLFDKDGKAL